MKLDISLLHAVVAVAKAGGFREAARVTGSNPSRLSDAVRRAEQQLGIRLFHRTTRSVSLTDAGRALMARLMPAMNEMESALDDINRYRDTPSGTLRLNVPISVSRLILPTIVPAFLARYPDIQLEIVAESNVQDVFREGCDAGIRYNEKLEQDVIAVPIGPRKQRFALAASADYLNQAGRPTHPHHLIQHRCLRGRFASGVEPEWEFEREGENVRVAARRAVGQHWRRCRPGGGYRHRRRRHRLPVRRVACALFCPRRTRTNFAAVVADLPRPVALLSRPPSDPGTAAGIY